MDQLEEACRYVDVPTVQNQYNLLNRRSEAVLERCERASIGFIAWFPIANGRLARPGGILDSIAQQLARRRPSWPLHAAPAFAGSAPNPGTSSVVHLEENVAAARLQLSDEQRRQLTQGPTRSP